MESDERFNSLVSAICNNKIEAAKQIISSVNLSEPERFESFCLAVSHDLTEIVKLMLANGFEFVNKDTGECPAFQSLAFNNNIEIIQILLEKGVEIDPSLAKAVLYLATCQDNATVIRLLLDRGVDILANVKGPFSCVHIAVEEECLSVLEFFLTNGADANTRYPSYGNTGQGDTLLHRAVMKGNEALVELLCRCNADVSVRSSNGATPLHIAAERGSQKIADCLVKSGANISELTTPDPNRDYFFEKFHENGAVRFFLNSKPPSIPDVVVADIGQSPLHVAVLNRHANMIKFLVERNADIDAEDSGGNSALRVAVEKGNLAVVDLVLSYSPNVNSTSNRQALNFAMQSYRDDAEKIAERLLQYGFTVDLEGADVQDLLYKAVCNNHIKIVDDLLNKGGNVNEIYPVGSDEKLEYLEPTLLHLALSHDEKDMINLLLSYGANINAKPDQAECPILYSIENRNSEIYKLLIDKGACVPDDANILLITAVQENLLDIVKDLISKGVDVNKTVDFDRKSFNLAAYDPFTDAPPNSRYEKSALFMAAEKGFEKIVQLLGQNGANTCFKTIHDLNPLLIAVIHGHFKVVNVLLELGASLETFDSHGRTALHLAAEIGREDIIGLLIRYDAKVDGGPEGVNHETALFCACKKGHLEAVECLIKFGANIRAVDWQGRTPLFSAAKYGQHKVVELLLNRGADFQSYDIYGATPLSVSAEAGHLMVVDALLKYDTDIGLAPNSLNALHEASRNGHIEIVKLLLRHGAKINLKINGSTPLMDAVKEGHVEVVEILLKEGANPNVIDSLDTTALQRASFEGNQEIAELLIVYGAKVNPSVKDYDIESPLCAAANGNHIHIVDTLFKAGVSNDVSNLACRIAAEKSHDEFFELLLNTGANLDPEEGEKMPFFLNYARKGNLNVITALLRQGANVNISDLGGKTALHFAAEHGHLDLVKRLLDQGAKVDAKTKNDETALHFSAAGGHLEIAEVLLQKGADVDSADSFNRTALFLAAEHGCNEVVKILLESEANVNPTVESETNKTPLLVASERGYFEIVKLLLQYGAKLNARDIDGLTALYFAVEFGHEETVKSLVEKGASIDCRTRNNVPLWLIAAERGHWQTILVILSFGSAVDVFGIPELKDYLRNKVPKWKPKVLRSVLTASYVTKDYGYAVSDDLASCNIPRFFEIFMNHDIHLNLAEQRNYNILIRALVRYTLKLKAANLFVGGENIVLTDFSDEDQISQYQTRCEAEVEKMKSHLISDTNVSMYNVLTANFHQSTLFAKNPHIFEYFSSPDFKPSYRIYFNLLVSQFSKGKLGRELQAQAVQILSCSSLLENLSNGDPDVAIEKIVSYLNVKDLRSVKAAVPCSENIA